MNNVTKIDRELNLKPGNYFRRLSTNEKYKDKLIQGILVLLTEVNRNSVSYTIIVEGQSDPSSWSTKLDDFLKEHEFVPNGRELRNRELFEAMNISISAAKELDDENEKLESIVTAFRPVSQIGDLEDSPKLLESEKFDQIEIQESRETGIALVNEPGTMLTQATEFIEKIADRRNDITLKQMAIKKLVATAEALMKEQKMWMEAMTQFNDAVIKLEKVIWTLNLYLGTGEEIIQLRSGQSAAASMPLTVRQLVLFMDEECALESETQGLDAYTMTEFDEWLLSDEKNLNLVLPEKKGVVALKPRRASIEYSDDKMINARMNEPNHKSYILIRNGDSLFRVCPEWEVGRFFFPTKEEFSDAFSYTKRYSVEEAEESKIDTSNWTEDERRWGKKIESVMTPDHDDYEDRVKSIDSRMDYYSKALLMLQGIVDRTGIFPEYQEIGLNLMDVTQWSDYLRFVHDADSAFLLTTGKETFAEFQKRVAESIELGDRIIGQFHQLERDYQRHEDTRKSPKNASDPEDFELYTLEGRTDDGGFKFFYQRKDKKSYFRGYPDYRRVEEEYKQRASFQIYKKDRGILPYDSVHLEDMEYFMTDRLSRHSYLTLFPLMKRIRNMKRVEKQEEEPFLQLLISTMKNKGDSRSDRELYTEALSISRWYKFKNKFHRSLKKDEKLAFDEMVREYDRRQKQEIQREKTPDEEVVDLYKTDKTLLIAARTGYWVVLDRHDDHDIHVDRRDYTKNSKGWKLVAEKLGHIPGGEWQQWKPLYERKEWETWIKGSRAKDFATFTEIREFIDKYSSEIYNYAEDSARIRVGSWDKRKYLVMKRQALIGIELDDSRQIHFHFSLIYDNLNDKSESIQDVTVSYTWKRNKNGINKIDRDYHYYSNPVERLETNDRGKWNPRKNFNFTYFIDREQIQWFKEYRQVLEIQEKEIHKKRSFADSALSKLIKFVNDNKLAIEKEKYLARFGNPHLWDKSKDKTAVELWNHSYFSRLKKTIGELVVDGFDTEQFYGKSLNEIIRLTNAQIMANQKDKNSRDRLVASHLIEKKEYLDPETYILFEKGELNEENE